MRKTSRESRARTRISEVKSNPLALHKIHGSVRVRFSLFSFAAIGVIRGQLNFSALVGATTAPGL